MSNKTNTGGPAFPTLPEHGFNYGMPGMTLRDYFAAHAPITYQDAIEHLDCHGGEIVGPWPPSLIMITLVTLRTNYANAMLKESAA